MTNWHCDWKAPLRRTLESPDWRAGCAVWVDPSFSAVHVWFPSWIAASGEFCAHFYFLSFFSKPTMLVSLAKGSAWGFLVNAVLSFPSCWDNAIDSCFVRHKQLSFGPGTLGVIVSYHGTYMIDQEKKLQCQCEMRDRNVLPWHVRPSFAFLDFGLFESSFMIFCRVRLLRIKTVFLLQVISSFPVILQTTNVANTYNVKHEHKFA